MACNFSIPVSGPPIDTLKRAASAVRGQGGTFNGDSLSGSFEIGVMGSTIRGSYVVSGDQIEITIDSKPFLIPCSTIESFLRNQLR